MINPLQISPLYGRTFAQGAPSTGPSPTFVSTYSPDIAIATVDLNGQDPAVFRLRKATSLTTRDFLASEWTVAEINTWAAGEDVEVLIGFDQSGNGNDITYNSPGMVIEGGTMYTYTNVDGITYPVIDFLTDGFDWGDLNAELTPGVNAMFLFVNRGDNTTSENEVCYVGTAEATVTDYVGYGNNAGDTFDWYSNAGTPQFRVNGRVYPLDNSRDFQAFCGENNTFDIQSFETVDTTTWSGKGLRIGPRQVDVVPQSVDYSGQSVAFIAFANQPIAQTRKQIHADINDLYRVHPTLPSDTLQEGFTQRHLPDQVFSTLDLVGTDPYVCLMSYGFQYYKAFRASQIFEAGMTQWAFRNSALQDIDIFKFYNQVGDSATEMICDMEVTRNELFFTQTTNDGRELICGQVNDSLDWADLQSPLYNTNGTWSLILDHFASDQKFVHFGTQETNTAYYLGYGDEFDFDAGDQNNNLGSAPLFYINDQNTPVGSPNDLYLAVQGTYGLFTWEGVNNISWPTNLRVFPREVSIAPGVNASFDGNFLGFIRKNGPVSASWYTDLMAIFGTVAP